jgi:hypothetical protein
MSAFFIRDFLEEMSYPLTFAMRWGGIFFRLVTFYFLGNYGGRSHPAGPIGGGYSLRHAGLAGQLSRVALTAISNNILYAYTGTLEAMLVTPLLYPPSCSLPCCTNLYGSVGNFALPGV